MTEIVIASAARTPVGSFNGAFASLSVHALGTIAIQAALSRVGVKPEEVDEVIMGQILTAGAGQNPARQAAINAGIPAAATASAPWRSRRSRSAAATPRSWSPAGRRA